MTESQNGRPRGVFQNLRIVTTVVLFLAFVAFAAVQWVSARWLYEASFGKAERRDALAQARHAQAVANYPRDYLKRMAIDNAMWDEAYNFMLGHNPRHPQSLLAMTDSFRMLRLSAFGFVGIDGKVVYARQFDSARERLLPASPDIVHALQLRGTIGRHYRPGSDVAGYSRVGTNIYAWCAAPIFRTDGSGPSNGWWILLSELDAAFLQNTSQAVSAHATLAIRPLAEGQDVAVQTPLDAQDLRIVLTDDSRLDARFALGMLDDHSELDLVVSIPREVHAAATRASVFLFWIALLFGTALSALALWFIERRLLHPVEAASKDLVKIGRSGDLSSRLAAAPRDDELGKLVDAINRMLTELEGKQDVEIAMLSAIPDALLRVDRAGTVLEVRVPEEVKSGRSWPVPGTELTLGYPAAAAQRMREALQRAFQTRSNQHVEYSLTRSDERLAYFEARIRMINTAQALVLLRDITERKDAESRVSRLAYFDSLTGLPNRAAFMDRLAREVRRARRSARQFGLLFLDLDGFKQINDTMGHDRGDQVLLWAAERLREALRPADALSHLPMVEGKGALARLGGDEFTLLIPDIAGPENLLAVAQRIGATMRRPFSIDGREFLLTTSIGVAIYPDDGLDAQTLLQHADTAMYHAKRSGRDNSQFYSASLTVQAMKRLDLENNLRMALVRNEFQLVYQPIIEAASGRMVCVEALLRWHHPSRGLIAPLEFISLAEENGLIGDIGYWVLQQSCQDLAQWHRLDLPLRVAVNLSPKQFSRADLVATVMKIMAECALPPGALELEITEGAVVENFAKTIATLNEFRKAGVRIALDDFGTGYSSLSYLLQMPIDAIKIDRSFVGRLSDEGMGGSIVQAVLGLGVTLGVSITAEGVETLEQALTLKAMACHHMQGYYFSRPLPAAQIAALARRVWTFLDQATETSKMPAVAD